MKKIFFIILVSAFVFASCENDTEGVSKVTTYPVLSLEEGDAIFWPLNTPFVEPGYTALEGETDITDKVVINNNVNVSAGGAYTVSYKVANSDGFYANATRTVYVYDESAAYNGFYSSSITRNYNGASATRGSYSILLFGIGNDQYWIEDLLGGWYYIGSNYGAAYAGLGVIKVNADSSLDIVSSEPLAWGYPCEFYAASSVDAATKTFTIKVIMEDAPTMLFDVTLSNPEPLN